MAVLKLKYIHRFRDRHGKQRYYFRRQGYQQVPLRGLPGSSEFMADYQAALAGEIGGRRQIGGRGVVAGTIAAAAVGYLSSVDFLSLSEGTRKLRRRAVDRFRREYGDKPVRSLQAHHIKAMMAAKIETPNAANFLVQTIHWLMKYSMEMEWRKDDPTIGIKKIEVESEGFHSWSEEEIAIFESCWPVGSKQRLAFDLLLHTGQRSGDVRRMNRSQVKDGVVSIKQHKTGAWVFIPIAKELQRSLNHVPSTQFVWLLTRSGEPFSEKGFSNYIVKAAHTAGLPQGCSAHGLRKAAAVRLAEAGCTNHEIMSITGHKTMQEVERYTRAVRQAGLARSAVAKVALAREARADEQPDNTEA